MCRSFQLPRARGPVSPEGPRCEHPQHQKLSEYQPLYDPSQAIQAFPTTDMPGPAVAAEASDAIRPRSRQEILRRDKEEDQGLRDLYNGEPSIPLL